MTARSRELAGVVGAALIAGVALATVTISRDAEVSPSAALWGAFFLALYLVAHIVVRRTVPYADGALLPLAAVLTAFGVASVYRLDSTDGGRQALWVAVGVGVFAATLVWLRHDYRILESYRYIFGVSALVLLLLPSAPGLGTTVNGVRLWVDLGPLQFQPGELAKICLIVFLAAYLREKREALARGRLKDIGPLLVIWGASMLVIVQTHDLGSALLNFGIFLAMLYVATGRALYVAASNTVYWFSCMLRSRSTSSSRRRRRKTSAWYTGARRASSRDVFNESLGGRQSALRNRETVEVEVARASSASYG